MKLKLRVTKQLPLVALIAMMVLLASGLARANDPDLSITPVIAHFPQAVPGFPSPPMTFRVKNTHTTISLQLSTVSIVGTHASEFQLGTNNCAFVLMSTLQECTIEVRFNPTGNGTKMAKLEVSNTSDANTPVLVAFLSNDEDSAKAAERRLPPVLFSLSIPDVMDKATTPTLTWSILGYHDSYESVIAFFDCTGKTFPTCGANFVENFANSGLLSSVSTTPQPAWKYNGETAVAHNFSYSFNASTFPQTTPPGNHQIVVRIYNRNNIDKMSGEPTISLMNPGNLTATTVYYDSEGRRITKYISIP